MDRRVDDERFGYGRGEVGLGGCTAEIAAAVEMQSDRVAGGDGFGTFWLVVSTSCYIAFSHVCNLESNSRWQSSESSS
jgi:hypothetical protein